MGKPLEMRGWAVKHTAPDGKVKLLAPCWASRNAARYTALILRKDPEYRGHRYTVVPVVIRERADG